MRLYLHPSLEKLFTLGCNSVRNTSDSKVNPIISNSKDLKAYTSNSKDLVTYTS